MRWFNLIANAIIVWWFACEVMTPGDGVIDTVGLMAALAMLGYELKRDSERRRR